MPETDNVTTANKAEKTETAQPSDEVKNLQRKLNKANNRSRELAEQLAEKEANNPVSRLEDHFTKLVGLLAETPLFEEGQRKKIADFGAEVGRRRQVDEQVSGYRKEIYKLLGEYDGDWESDDSMSAFRDSLKASDFNTALRELQRVTLAPKSTSKEELEALVNAKVQETLKTLGRVDTGTSTAPATGRITLGEVSAISPKGRTAKDMIKEQDRVLDQFFAAKK